MSMKPFKITKVTCEVYKWISNSIISALESAGIYSYHIQTGRNIVIREHSMLGGLISKTGYEEDPSDIFRFYVHQEYEERLLNYLIKKCELDYPGRGTIYSEEVMLYNHELLQFDLAKLATLPSEKERTQNGFTGIYCIIQRGLAGSIVKSVLDMGFCVPSITYGEGGGFRDKLGLLRVAIPSEKEIINLVVSKHDAADVMNILVDTARLDQPGKGFIYMYPIKHALLNTRLFRGKLKQMASIEQIISAIDDVKGNNEWRRKFSESDLERRAGKRKYLKKMVDFTIYANEGTTSSIVNAAMENGAGGATIYKLNYKSAINDYAALLPAREMSDLVINDAQTDGIFAAITNAGIFDENHAGLLEVSPVPIVCTYIANVKRQ